jgi:hypothetical protein
MDDVIYIQPFNSFSCPPDLALSTSLINPQYTLPLWLFFLPCGIMSSSELEAKVVAQQKEIARLTRLLEGQQRHVDDMEKRIGTLASLLKSIIEKNEASQASALSTSSSSSSTSSGVFFSTFSCFFSFLLNLSFQSQASVSDRLGELTRTREEYRQRALNQSQEVAERTRDRNYVGASGIASVNQSGGICKVYDFP